MSRVATLVISRAVRPGRLDAFREWADRLDDAAAARDGYQSALRLEQSGGLHHLVYRFDGLEPLQAWRDADDHRQLMAEGSQASVGSAQVQQGERVKFDLPSEAGARKWKTFLVTWLAVLPILLLVSSAARALLKGWSPVVQTGLSSLILTVLLTWVIQPRVQRWSKFWLLQDGSGRLAHQGDKG